MKRNKIIAAVSWCFVAACMAVIFFLSAQNGEESQELSETVALLLKLGLSVDFIRSCAHCLEFMGLAVLVFNALYWSFGYFRPYLAFVLTAAYAASDEIHQLFVDGRACQLSDFLTDSFGAFIGIIAASIIGIICLNIKRRRFG